MDLERKLPNLELRILLEAAPIIRLVWLERVLEQPQQVEPDLIDPELEHRLGRIDEYEGRVLRVIVKTGTPLITAYFDRTTRSKL